MGCDGGTKPTRAEQIKVKARVVLLDPSIKRDAQWKHCQLSNEFLREPVVACELGRLYNKEALLQFLLNRDSASESQISLMKHVRKLKDTKTLRLHQTTPAASAAAPVTAVEPVFSCPVTGWLMNGLCFYTHVVAFLRIKPFGKYLPSSACSVVWRIVRTILLR